MQRRQLFFRIEMFRCFGANARSQHSSFARTCSRQCDPSEMSFSKEHGRLPFLKRTANVPWKKDDLAQKVSVYMYILCVYIYTVFPNHHSSGTFYICVSFGRCRYTKQSNSHQWIGCWPWFFHLMCLGKHGWKKGFFRSLVWLEWPMESLEQWKKGPLVV